MLCITIPQERKKYGHKNAVWQTDIAVALRSPDAVFDVPGYPVGGIVGTVVGHDSDGQRRPTGKQKEL